jgi:small conductance mechanosensitive channel
MFGYLLQIRTDSIAHRLSRQAYNWIVTTGPMVVLGIIVFLAGQLALRFVNKGLARLLSAKRFDATIRPFLQNTLQFSFQILLVLGVMQLMGIKMTLFAAIIGALGVAVGLALSGTLQNFAGGVLIIMLKPFRVGDNIRTQNEEGTVTAIRLFYSVIRLYNNTTVIVPNSKLSNDVIFNVTRDRKRRIDIPLQVAYTVDYKAMEPIIQEVISSAEYLREPPSRIGIDKMEFGGYTVSVQVWVDAHGFEDTRLELNKRLLVALRDVINKKI